MKKISIFELISIWGFGKKHNFRDWMIKTPTTGHNFAKITKNAILFLRIEIDDSMQILLCF